MNRIQEILKKADQEGTARRTRGLAGNVAEPPFSAPAAAPPLRQAPTYDAAPWTAAATAPVLEPAALTTAVPTLDPHLVAVIAPQSAAAERYRMLRTRIKRAEQGRTVRSIVVTSPAKGDGKSLTAANLALTMAQEFHQRVLLLDADLRHPTMARLFGIPPQPGLTEVLLGASELDAALVHLPEQRLTLLPAGGPPAQPTELLGSAAMRRVLEMLRTRFDRILIDTPPVAPIADVHVLATLADGLLVIVRAGSTQKPAIERALTGMDASKVLGLVLNAVHATGHDSYHTDGYSYLGG